MSISATVSSANEPIISRYDSISEGDFELVEGVALTSRTKEVLTTLNKIFDELPQSTNIQSGT